MTKNSIKIIKVHTVITKRHKNQSFIWKRLHQAKMLVCKHSIEPKEKDLYSYIAEVQYGECINCEALCELKG